MAMYENSCMHFLFLDLIIFKLTIKLIHLGDNQTFNRSNESTLNTYINAEKIISFIFLVLFILCGKYKYKYKKRSKNDVYIYEKRTSCVMFPLLDVRETDQYGLHETNSHKKDQGNLRIISKNSSQSHL